MSLHTSYKIYPIAIQKFINDNYEFNEINFGNIKNNVIAILEKLKIENNLYCEWDVNPIYFFDKINISKNKNRPSDFDEYSNFNFTFNAKEGVSSEDFEKSIKVFKNEFINKYQLNFEKKREEFIKNINAKNRRNDRLTYIILGSVLIALFITIFWLNLQK